MAAYNKFNQFIEDQFEGIHDWDAHTFKVYLSNATPNGATHAIKADIAEIAATGGYVLGGGLTTIGTSRSGGNFKAVGSDVPFLASGGSIGPFQHAILYNDTATNKPLVAWWSYPSTVTLANGESFTVDFDLTNGIFQAT